MRAVKNYPRVLCLFDYKATTGFATVSQNIVKQLRRLHVPVCLDIVAINYFGDKRVEQEDDLTRIIVPSPEERQRDELCRFPFLQALNNGPAGPGYYDEYDGYFILQDPGVAIGMLPNIMEINYRRHKEGRKKLYGIFYFPIDSVPQKQFFNREEDPKVKALAAQKFPGYLESLRPDQKSLGYFDQLITYTEYGRREILKKAPWLKDKLSVIPHGVDTSVFFPMTMEAMMDFKKEYFADHVDKFIIINVNRNQFRKDIPRTMAGFQQFRDTWAHPGQRDRRPFLYLHMHPDDELGWNLRLIGDQLDLVEGEDYGFPPEGQQRAGSDLATLRGIYNVADVFLTTTTGEGWGLTITEAMACGCPVIAPGHTSIIEIGGLGVQSQRILALVPSQFYCETHDHVIRQAVDPMYVASAIQDVYRERPYAQMARALEYAKSLSWDRLGYAWKEVFEQFK